MKTILLFSILLYALAMPLCAETQEISEIKDDIATIKIDLAVLTSEVKNLKENVNKRFDGIDKRFDGIDKRFDGIEKGFDRLNNIIIACIGIPLAILAIGATVWGILAHRRSGKTVLFPVR